MVQPTDKSAEHVQKLLNEIASVGSTYGMELHWGKFQLLRVGDLGPIYRPDGTEIEAKSTMSYLGTNLNETGDISSELGQKLGTAWSD